MKRLRHLILVAGLACAAAPWAFAQESKPAAPQRGQGVERTEEKMEEEEARLIRWKWANFVVLAGAIIYMVAKNGGPFFAARSKQIRKEMMEAGEVRKDAETRAAVVDRKLASLSADITQLKTESKQERESETERLRRHREAERAKIQAHAEREIESAGKAARLELQRYASMLAVRLAEQKIRARMNADVQDVLVSGFLRDMASASGRSASTPGGRS
jgi:F-type H+-transporting ATPase subunit b